MQILDYQPLDRGGKAKVSLVTKIFNITHVITLKVYQNGSIEAHETRDYPGHPHINNTFVCLDKEIVQIVKTLCQNGEYKNAITLIAIALETINMRSAYTQRYTHLLECHICNQWKLKETVRVCSRCGTQYCQDCKLQCECGQGDLGLCKKCENTSRAKCLYCIVEEKFPGKSILRLTLEPRIESLMLQNNIKTIKEIEEVVNGTTRIKGIGPAKLASISEAYRISQEEVNA